MYVQLTMAERLKDLRVIDKKLTLEQLAEQTGLSKSALGKYESEDCGDINHYAIQKLAKFYGVSTDYVVLTISNNWSSIHAVPYYYTGERFEKEYDDYYKKVNNSIAGDISRAYLAYFEREGGIPDNKRFNIFKDMFVAE